MAIKKKQGRSIFPEDSSESESEQENRPPESRNSLHTQLHQGKDKHRYLQLSHQ